MNRRHRPVVSRGALVAVVLLMGGLLGTFRPAQAAILSPTLTSVSPSQVYPGKTNQKLVLSGDFTSNDTVSFSPSTGITIVGAVNRPNTNTIEVNITVAADAPNTARDVTVRGGLLNGSSTCSKCLTIGPDVTGASGVNGTLSNGANSGSFQVTGHAFKTGAAVKIERKSYGFGAAETVTVNGTNVQVTPGTAQNGMVSSLTATVSTLNQPAGRWKVTVVNPDGNTASFGDGVTTGLEIAGGKPTLATITPAQINNGQELQFTLTGDNFARGLTATVSDPAVTQTQAATITSKTQATITLRAATSGQAPGARTLVLRNADGQSSSNAGALWVNQAPQPAGTPTIASVSPALVGLGADKVVVKVTGTNFGSPVPAVTVSNPTGVTIAVTRDSSTQLTLAVSVANNAQTGARTLTVTNPDNTSAVQNNALTIASDFNVTHATPAGRPQGFNGTFQINGSGFTGAPSVSISGSGATAGSVTVDSAARLTVGVTVTSNATPGPRDITVTQAGNQQRVCSGCFVVGEVPTVASVSPSSGNGGGQVAVDVTGTKFAANPSVTLERTGQNPVNMILVNRESDTKISGTFDLTNAAPGVWDLRVTNADGGTGTKASAFTVAVGNPTVTNANPDFVSQNDATEVIRITGTQFAPGMTVTIPDAGGVTVKDTKRLSNTSADVTLATTDNARLGSRDVVVTNTDGKSGTCPSCFVVTQGQQAKNFGPGVTAFENFTNGAFVGAGNIDGVPVNGIEFVLGVNSGGGPHVKPFRVNPANGNIQELGPGWFAYPAGFTGGVHVAVGNVDGNAANGDEIITAAGPGGGPHVKVWRLNNDLTATELGGYFAYPQFTGGVWVATGDVDGDGTDEIITGAGAGGGPHVRVVKFNGGSVVDAGGWFAYGSYPGGVVVGAGNFIPEDSELTQKDEVVTAPASAGGPHIRITQGTGAGQLLRQFFAFTTEDPRGYRVGAGDFDFDTVDDLAVGRGSDSEMLIAQVSDDGFVRIVNPNPTPFGNLPTGTNVAGGDIDADGDDDVIIVPDHNNAVTVRLLRATSLT